MRKVTLFIVCLFVSCISFAQINNFEDERNNLFALDELVAQSYSEQFNETIGTIQEDPDEANRQWLQLDPMSMNLVYYKTPYEKADDGKNLSEIIWKAKFIIPLYEIDTLIGDNKKNTITVKMKDGKSTIQTYMIMSGNEYYPATKNNKLVIHSNKLLKIRNLDKRLNWRISELQNFHKKKLALVDYLNKKMQKEVEYQVKDSLNYPEDRKFKVIKEFHLDNGGHFLNLIVERKNYYGKPIIEKQSVMLKDITEVVKDINIILKAKDNSVIKNSTFINNKGEKQDIETVDNLFFLQWCYEKNNEEIGNEIQKLFGQLGTKLSKNYWYD